MSAKASPRPWFVNGHSIEANDPDGLWLQNEKTGRGVVANLPSCPKSRMSKKNRETWDAIVEANAALIVESVNERDRLRDELADKTRNYEDVIAFHTRTEESLRDLVRKALPFIEGAIDTVSTIIGDAEMSKAVGECGAPPKDVLEAFVADGRRVLRDALAAIGGEKQ